MTVAPDAGAVRRLMLLADRLEDEVAGRIAALLSEGIEEERAPRAALVMMSVTDPFDTRFHLGEVLVTESVVALGAVRGWGLTTGDAPQRARLKAIVDALARGAEPARLEDAIRLLAPEEERLERERCREAELVARTRVEFDLMPGSGVSP